MEVLHTEIDIDARRDIVWRVLTDFPSYPEWNPFIRSVEGAVLPGARIDVRIEAPGLGSRTFRPRVLRLEAETELRWLGRLVLPGLFDGEHCFLIEDFRPDRVRFFHREIFRGVLVGLAADRIEAARAGFEAMNGALRERSERLARSSRA